MAVNGLIRLGLGKSHKVLPSENSKQT